MFPYRPALKSPFRMTRVIRSLAGDRGQCVTLCTILKVVKMVLVTVTEDYY